MLRLFKSNQPVIIILIILIAIALWGKDYFFPVQTFLAAKSTSLAGELLNNYLKPDSVLLHIISLIYVVSVSFFMILFNKRFVIIEIRSYLPALIFILISGFLPEQRVFHPVMIASVLAVFAWYKLFETYKSSTGLSKYFDAGFLVSLGVFFYTGMIFFLPVMWICMTNLQTFGFRSWLVNLIGFIIPQLFMASCFFYFGSIDSYLILFKKTAVFDPGLLQHHYLYQILFGFIILLVLISVLHFNFWFKNKKTGVFKFYTSVFWIFLLSFAATLFFSSDLSQIATMIAFPASFLIANYLCIIRNSWIGGILLTILMFFVFAADYLPDIFDL